MTDATPPHDEDGPHEGPIKTPKQLVMAVVFAFLVPIVTIILLANYVDTGKRVGAGSEGLTAQAIAERIRPVGTVEVKDVSDAGTQKTGEQVYASVCIACHGTGNLGAPKFGDVAAWAPRITQGFETLLNHALKGYKAMPAQGGGDYTDLEIGRAVVYMADKAGAKFEEPKMTVQPASAPASGAPVAAASAPTTSTPTNSQAVNATAPAAAVTAASAPSAAGASTTSAAAATPPALYTQTCSACHGTGALGAPKLGDKAAWAPRIAQGVDTLVANAMKGKNAMPPKGGSNASEAEIRAVVNYMVSQAK